MKQILLIIMMVLPSLSQARIYDIRDYNAVGDSSTLNTAAIQKAIDDCSADGGGIVLIQGGNYLTGTIFMKTGVTLRIERGAVLSGSKDIDDYAVDVMKNMYRDEPYMDRCLIFSKGQSDFGIEGGGVINGNGESFPNPRPGIQYRPMLIRFADCKHIRVRDVRLLNPGGWTSAWLYCDDIVVDGVTIFARARGNGDGLDFDGCTQVRVSNCSFDTSDDSICLQTSDSGRPCRDISITNCQFCSRWAGIRIGLLSRADFENVIVSSCIFRNTNDSGLKIQMNEGAEMRNMLFTNLLMVNVPRPIFLTHTSLRAFTDGEEEYPPMKTMGNLTFCNIHVDNSAIGKESAIVMTSLPGNYIHDITLSDITMYMAGGGTVSDSRTEFREFSREWFEAQDRRRWPEYGYLGGTVPAHGIYLRHMKNVNISNVFVVTANPDERPALKAVDVKHLIINGKTVKGDNVKKLNGM